MKECTSSTLVSAAKILIGSWSKIFRLRYRSFQLVNEKFKAKLVHFLIKEYSDNHIGALKDKNCRKKAKEGKRQGIKYGGVF